MSDWSPLLSPPPADGTDADPGPATARVPGTAPPAPRRRAPIRLRGVATLSAVALLAGAGGAAAATALDDDPAPAAAAGTGTTVQRASATLAGEALDVAGVVDAVGPAVVSIQTEVAGRPRGTGAGTGIVLSADGEILTNAHVVEGATTIRVTLAGESQSREAELVGADAGADLALLRLDGAEGLPVAELGSSADLAVGDDVVAIGNALALRGGPTVTRGIVSALDRTLQAGGGTMTGLVQTDASISSGNSGGPLVNAAGQVVGINTAVATSAGRTAAENIGFAIAIDQALPIVDRLRDGTATAPAGFLGIRVADPDDGSRGALVADVTAGSPADEAGIEAGDLVVEVGGRAVPDAASLVAAVRSHEPGETLAVTVSRDGEERRLSVELSEAPTS